ncbi:MAG: 23S rRNA (uridine2552-2'-O)-methyltransferase [Parasphingorhabdus sp.]|jgi:23S rRNA (uridine2552-2'-O)-methyltransferase
MSRKKTSKNHSSASSSRWLNRQKSDSYVQSARQSGFRSRAVFKLQQLDQRDRLIKPGMTIVDLGAAPGGWSQYAASRMSGNGRVVAIDRLEMKPLEGVEFLHGDFLDPVIIVQLFELIAGGRVDLVLSDLSPNHSGVRAVDEARSMELIKAALGFAQNVLKSSGVFAIKAFEGGEIKPLTDELKRCFRSVNIRKPEASRAQSREIYLVAKGYNGSPSI